MATYITGDCHGEFIKLITFIQKMQLGKNDNIIILGDMGLFWRKDKKDSTANIEMIEQNCNEVMIYFIDGNHENFDQLEQLPKDPDNGDLRVASPHIRWITRATVLTFEGKKCLFIGGADSVDKIRRIDHLSWWKAEQITKENIDLVPYDHYDYIFTHCCPYSVLDYYRAILTDPIYSQENIDHTSEYNLEEVANFVDFDKWYFGHYHQDCHLDETYTCLYYTFDELV